MRDNKNDPKKNSRIISFAGYKKESGKNQIEEKEKNRVPSAYIHPELDDYIESYYFAASIKENVMMDMYEQLQEVLRMLKLNPSDFKPDMKSVKAFMNLDTDLFMDAPELPGIRFEAKALNGYDYTFETMIRRDEDHGEEEWLCGMMTRQNDYSIWHYNLEQKDWDCVYEVNLPRSLMTILKGADCAQKRLLKEISINYETITVKEFHRLCNTFKPLIDLEEQKKDLLRFSITQMEDTEEEWPLILQPKNEYLGGFGISWDSVYQKFNVMQVMEEELGFMDAVDLTVRTAYVTDTKGLSRVLKHLFENPPTSEKKELRFPLSAGVYLSVNESFSNREVRFAGKERPLNKHEQYMLQTTIETLGLMRF